VWPPSLLRFLKVWTLVLILVLTAAGSATADELPDGRVYELVTPAEMNGVVGSVAFPSPDGDVVDWAALGGCCGATTGGEELFQSRRGPEGWQTKGLTPAPRRSLEGFLEMQAPVFWSRDLDTTIFNTPETYDPADTHPGTLSLYAVGEDGVPDWVSQGPLSTTAAPSDVTFDGADPEAHMIIFSTRSQVTPDAVGLNEELNTPPQYLYARDLTTGTTTLVDVKTDGTIVDPDGAILGDGAYIGQGTVAPNVQGSTTNAVSADGEKVFFESPPPEVATLGPTPQAHLYMRNLATATTTALDEPSSTGFARYEGASEDGSLVFFRSDEGLGGTATDLELYEFNTTDHAIGPAPPMSAVPVSDGDGGSLDGHLLGISAISNDGSHVYFVAEGVLTNEANGLGQTAQANQPNFYVFDTATGSTAFIAILGGGDISHEFGLVRGPLIKEPDLERPAVPTPDGSVLVFESKGDLTGENPEGPTGVLALEAPEENSVIDIGDTAGMVAGRQIRLGEPGFFETYVIKAVKNATELELTTPLRFSWSAGTPLEQLGVAEVYRYADAGGELICVSCIGPGVRPIEASGLTGMGGSYAPGNEDATMSADGSQIFFMSAEALSPEAEGPKAMRVYEWEGGALHLISRPHSTESTFVFGSTPSGDDVFITTADQLVPEAEPGHLHTYDARVGGGFPVRPPADEHCSGTECPPTRTSPSPFSTPATAGSRQGKERRPRVSSPSFRLAMPSAHELALSARTGRLRLTIRAASPGTAIVRAFGSFGGRSGLVGTSRVVFSHGRLTRRAAFDLSAAARARLAAHAPLPLTIELRDTRTAEVTIERVSLHLPANPRHPGRSR
jgi:hypothetical protein